MTKDSDAVESEDANKLVTKAPKPTNIHVRAGSD